MAGRACARRGCSERSRNLYLLADGKIGFDKPAAATKAKYDEYVSDPAKPVPYRVRPTLAGSAAGLDMGRMARRTISATPPRVRTCWCTRASRSKEPVRVAGQPIANLFASTSGTDADWVVKIIDVWPAEDPDHPKLGGYQWMISADILRGRYRQDPANPQAASRRTRCCRTGCRCRR